MYFFVFPWDCLPSDGGIGADVGCGSGRWAMLVAPRVKKLYLIDASPQALEVAKKNLFEFKNVEFILASIDIIPLPNESLDFAYSLGVIHHVPDPYSAIISIASKLKPGAPLLLYLYYAFDNRPWWYVALWRCSTILRHIVSRMPYTLRGIIADLLATVVYYPLARGALLFEKLGINVQNWPLAFYRDKSFYLMRTCALDRFGTKIEHRFTRKQIEHMLQSAGFYNIRFSPYPPYWCVSGIKR